MASSRLSLSSKSIGDNKDMHWLSRKSLKWRSIARRKVINQRIKDYRSWLQSRSLNWNNISYSGSIVKLVLSSGQSQHSLKNMINFTLDSVNLFPHGYLIMLNLIHFSSSLGAGSVTMSRNQLVFWR